MIVSKKKIKAFVLSGAIATSLFGVASEGSAETLGWSEDGNLTENSVNTTLVTNSSSGPDCHNGWSEYYDEQ